MIQQKKKVAEIPAEKMALLAEKGLKAARLSRDEMHSLANGGLMELYAIRDGRKSPTPQLDQQSIENVMAVYFPATVDDAPAPSLIDLSIKLTNTAVDVVTRMFGWQCNSPAFAQRGTESGTVSFCKEFGKCTIHLEIAKSGYRRACIHVRLTDKSKRERSTFDVALFQGDQCIESVHVNQNPVASFSAIAPGNYLLKVSDKKGEIASVQVRLEE